MSTLPGTGDFDVGNIADNDDFAGKAEALRSVVEEMLGGADEEALTVAGGSITPTVGSCNIDGQGGTDDDLANALQTNHDEGKLLLIRAKSATAKITIKHLAGGAGQFFLNDAKDLVLENGIEWVLFKRNGTRWDEVFRSIPNRLHRVLIVTEGVGAPKVLLASDSGKRLENTGAAAATYATLPDAVVGANFLAYVAAAQTFRLTAAGADTVRDAAATGTTFTMAAVVGNYFEVECIVDNEWVVVRKAGVLTTA